MQLLLDWSILFIISPFICRDSNAIVEEVYCLLYPLDSLNMGHRSSPYYFLDKQWRPVCAGQYRIKMSQSIINLLFPHAINRVSDKVILQYGRDIFLHLYILLFFLSLLSNGVCWQQHQSNCAKSVSRTRAYVSVKCFGAGPLNWETWGQTLVNDQPTMKLQYR